MSRPHTLFMKLLPLDSKLRYPLKNLDSRQVLFCNAIRYASDICEISYNRLIKNLSVLAEKGSISSDDFPNIYSDVWSIINNAAVFKKLISREFYPIPVDANFTEIIKAISLRDSNQHLDERLDEIHKNEFPVYGSISWTKKLLLSKEMIITISYSGTFTNKESINSTVTNENLDELNEVIQKLELTGIIREGRKSPYTYRKESVYINKILKEMIVWINHLDKIINKQSEFLENKEPHVSDLFIQFKGYEIEIPLM